MPQAEAASTRPRKRSCAQRLGEQIDLDVFGRATGNLRRVWDSLGLKREARDINAESDQATLDRILNYVEEPAP